MKTRSTRVVLSMFVTLATAVALSVSTVAFAAVSKPEGAAAPIAATGIGTAAAMKRADCTMDNIQQEPYGRLDGPTQGSGGVCTKEWKAGADNGGATSKGVTADKVTVVALIPNSSQQTATGATNLAGGKGAYEDAFHDELLAYMRMYETWGRDIDLRMMQSSGADEAAQRADLLKIKEMKPFAVMDIVPTGLDVLDAELARAGIVVFGYSASAEESNQQAPYRWGLSDTQAAAVNASELIGKQLVKKKAGFGGDAVKDQTRKFATVYIKDAIDEPGFTKALSGEGVTLTASLPYDAPGSTLGDPNTAQQQAPTVVQRLKDSGATTVVLFTDVAMTKAMMEQAKAQGYEPEWLFTGTLYADLSILARNYPQDQMAHGFGMSSSAPGVVANPNKTEAQQLGTALLGPMQWYWGAGRGTYSPGADLGLTWLVRGIHAAGPKLTAKTFQQGLFSLPAEGGAAWDSPTGTMRAYGKTAGLPYDEYASGGTDFGLFWWNPDTVTTSGSYPGTGINWFVADGQRFRAGEIPTKPLGFFDESQSMHTFDSDPNPAPVVGIACTGCPSQGGAGTPGTPSVDGFVAEYVPRTTTAS